MADTFLPAGMMPNAGVWQTDPMQAASWLSNYQQGLSGSWLGQQQQQAADEARRRMREVEDRNFDLQLQGAARQRDDLALRVGQQKANEWYNKQLLELSKARMQMEQERQVADLTGMYNGQPTPSYQQISANLTGMHNGQPTPAYQQQQAVITGYDKDGNPTFARQQWGESAAMNRANMAANLRGPEDWIGYKQLTSGVPAGSPLTPGLSNWNTGGQMGVSGWAPGQNATPITLSKIMTDMGVGGSLATGGGGSTFSLTPAEQQFASVADQLAKNPHQIAGNWLEQQDPTTLSLLKGAAEKQGHDWQSVLSRHQQSRWGGGDGSVRSA